MKRIVQPELLDTLPPENPRAIHSRLDLRRVNACMGNHAIMASALESNWNDGAPRQLTELGAGDGHFLLSVAKTFSRQTSDTTAVLLDLQKNVSSKTLSEFAALGWIVNIVVADVFEWLQQAEPRGAIITNLFLHHFEDAKLSELLRLISLKANLFIAIEPRRSPWALLVSRLLWFIGCNDVTRHDAVVSVRAGFSGKEISALWPDQNKWKLVENRAGAFSHRFIARKIN